MTHRPNASSITDAQLDELHDEIDRLNADLAALRAVARGYCPDCGRGDAAPTVKDWEQQRQRADQAEELLRIAHDTSNKSEAERARAVQRAETAERDMRIYRDRLARLTDGYAEQFRRLEGAEAALERVREYADHIGRSGWTGPAIARRIHDAINDTNTAPGPAATQATGHVYLSTGCLHGHHDYCQADTGLGGAKTPAQCKWCTAPCTCPCHTEEQQ